MAIKFQELVQGKIRRSIPINLNGTTQILEVFNPSQEDRNYLLKLIDDKTKNFNKDEYSTKDEAYILTEVYKKITNIEFSEDESIADLLVYPNEAILYIHAEVQQFIQELMLESLILEQTKLNLLHQSVLAAEIQTKEKDLSSLLSNKNLVNEEAVKEIYNLIEK